MARKLLSPEKACVLLARRFESHRVDWLSGHGGDWPLRLSLGAPTEKDVVEDAAGVRSWVDGWAAWRGAGEVVWEERRWGRLGIQRLPAALVLESPLAVATIVGQAERWRCVSERYGRLVQAWPSLGPGTARQFESLAELSSADFERLCAFIAWIERNPQSGLYLRQLPIEGLDTKWVERHSSLVTTLMRLLRGRTVEDDLYALCGLRKPPYRIRMRVLCPDLRRAMAGLGDLEAPITDLVKLEIAPRATLIVENLETGLALPDLPGTVSFMKLGNAVGLLDTLEWLKGSRVFYWGDIDTHGFAILNRARRVFPALKSVLMDLGTICSHKHLWGEEATQHPDVDLEHLTDVERVAYLKLRSGELGPKVRLEQERIAWPVALDAIRAALGAS